MHNCESCQRELSALHNEEESSLKSLLNYHCGNLWNNLPNPLKHCDSLYSFKKLYKEFGNNNKNKDVRKQLQGRIEGSTDGKMSTGF